MVLEPLHLAAPLYNRHDPGPSEPDRTAAAALGTPLAARSHRVPRRYGDHRVAVESARNHADAAVLLCIARRQNLSLAVADHERPGPALRLCLLRLAACAVAQKTPRRDVHLMRPSFADRLRRRPCAELRGLRRNPGKWRSQCR